MLRLPTDVLTGHTVPHASPHDAGLVTASQTTDFPRSAQLGDRVTSSATVRRLGRKLAFTSCEFTSNGRLVLAASGVFTTTARKDPQP